MYVNPYYASFFPYPAHAPEAWQFQPAPEDWPYSPAPDGWPPVSYLPRAPEGLSPDQGAPQDWPSASLLPGAPQIWPPAFGGWNSVYPGLEGDGYPPEETRNPIVEGQDQGGKPFVIDIEEAAKRNTNFRTVIWTGKHLQLVLMSIGVGGDIGLEMHPNVDQFIRIEQGHALVRMGERRDRLDFVRRVSDDDAIVIPAGTWHNVTNIGLVPLKLYTIYAPPEHPKGTVHRTKAEAMAEHR